MVGGGMVGSVGEKSRETCRCERPAAGVRAFVIPQGGGTVQGLIALGNRAGDARRDLPYLNTAKPPEKLGTT